MILGGQLVKRAFMALWQANAKPTLRIVDPVGNWTLPAGVTYDEHVDTFVNELGVAQTVDATVQPYLEAKMIRGNLQNTAMPMLQIGVNTLDTKSVLVLHESTDLRDALDECWGVLRGGQAYRVTNYVTYPEDQGNYIYVRLDLEDR